MKKRIILLCYLMAFLILCGLSFVMPRFGVMLTADYFGVCRYLYTDYGADGFIRDYYTHPLYGQMKLTYKRFEPLYLVSVGDKDITIYGNTMFMEGVEISSDDLMEMFKDEEIMTGAVLVITGSIPWLDHQRRLVKNLGLIALPLLISAASLLWYQRNGRYKTLCVTVTIACGVLAVLQLIRIWDVLRMWVPYIIGMRY